MQIGENVVGVRVAVRDMMTPSESQIYNWGIKKDTSLDGIGRGTDDRISYGISSDVSSNPIVSQNGEKSTDSAKKFRKVRENPPRARQSLRRLGRRITLSRSIVWLRGEERDYFGVAKRQFLSLTN